MRISSVVPVGNCDFCRIASFSCTVLLIVLLSGSSFGNVGKRFFSFAVNEGNHFADRQQPDKGESGNVKPEIKSPDCLQRIPSRENHGWIDLAIAWIASLVFVMKLTALVVKARKSKL